MNDVYRFGHIGDGFEDLGELTGADEPLLCNLGQPVHIIELVR
jgi:hypothetical protein